MSDIGIHSTTKELKRLFDAANQELFGGELPPTQLTIQSGARGYLGWCSLKKIWSGVEDRYEINITPAYLNREVPEVVATLIHEMVHLANLHKGVRDCTGHQYHNKRFRNLAEQVGLVVEKVPSRGYAWTRLGDELAQWVEDQHPDPKAFALHRVQEDRTPAPTKMKKWSCGCTNVRCAVDLRAICEKCGTNFQLQEEGDDK